MLSKREEHPYLLPRLKDPFAWGREGEKGRSINVNSVEDILLSFNYLDSCQPISNLKISYRFVVNRGVCIKDELRDTHLFSVGYSNICLKMEILVEDLLAVCRRRVKSDICLFFGEQSLIHWFLLSSLSKHSFHTFFGAKIYLYHKTGWISC